MVIFLTLPKSDHFSIISNRGRASWEDPMSERRENDDDNIIVIGEASL